jgi:protein dithiol oxidoreductase (disulfide-forming)
MLSSSRVLAVLLALLPFTANAQPMAPGAPRLGVDYEVLQVPQPTFQAPQAGKIEVAEVFSYACSHCAHFHEFVEPWKKKLPADVRFVYVHSVGQPSWERFARGFFAAESKKLLDRTHDAMFKAVFIEQRIAPNASMDEIAQFYSAFGVSEKAFLELMSSPTVVNAANRSKQFSIRVGAFSTPTLIVAGKYRLTATPDRRFEGMLKTAEFLIAKERAAIAASAKKNPATAKK